MSQKARFEYYLVDGSIREFKSIRKQGSYKWETSNFLQSSLVAIITPPPDYELVCGPLANRELIARAILKYEGIPENSGIQDFGNLVPESLLKQLSEKLGNISEKTTKRWKNVQNEESHTGYFVGQLNDISFTDKECKVEISSFVSAKKKEHDVGADIGILIDIQHNSNRLVKAILVQAKRDYDYPTTMKKHRDFNKQVSMMRQTTQESYGLVYSKFGTYFITPDNPNSHISVGSLIADGVSCQRGDRRNIAIAQAINQSYVIEVEVDA